MLRNKLVQKFVSSTLICALLATTLTLPGVAAASSFEQETANRKERLLYVNGPFGTRYPVDNPREIATIDGRLGNTDKKDDPFVVRAGDKAVLNGNEAATMLGVSSKELSNLVYTFPTNAPMIIGLFNPDEAQLRIFVFQMKSLPSGQIKVFLNSYTPHHGERMRAAREYMTAAEKANLNAAGNNPFFGNRSTTDEQDPTFYNCGAGCMPVAIGHAMRYHNATYGLISQTELSMDDPEVRTSGGFFFKSVTTIYRGNVQPRWFVATPTDLQPNGLVRGVCAVNENPCAEGHKAFAGISIQDWKGGNLSSEKQKVYEKSVTTGGFTLIFFAVLLLAAVFSGGLALGLQAGTALGYGALAGAAYLGAYAIGGVSPTDLQYGLLGQTASDFGPAPTPGDEHARGTRQAVAKLTSAYNDSGKLKDLDEPTTIQGGDLTQTITLNSVRTVLIGGCDPALEASACGSSVSPGLVPRTDAYRERETAETTQKNFEDCIKAPGLTSESMSEKSKRCQQLVAPFTSFKDKTKAVTGYGYSKD